MLQIEIITQIERNQAITMIKDGITSSGGWITDHQLFSNHAASLSFELPHSAIELLLSRLIEAGLNPNVIGKLPKKTNSDIKGGVALSFIHNEPDMKRDVPPFG